MVETIVSADHKRTAQILFDGAQEILGLETIQKVTEKLQAGSGIPASRSMTHRSLEHAGLFLNALEKIYGEPGARGLALRIGRASFQYGLKYYEALAEFRTMEFRLQPAPRRLESGLRTLAQIVANESNNRVVVTDEGDHWLWKIERSPRRQTSLPASRECFLLAGLLQEFTTWASGGRFHQIVETECRSAGCPACLFRIGKKPID